jgi:hypothetical protein
MSRRLHLRPNTVASVKQQEGVPRFPSDPPTTANTENKIWSSPVLARVLQLLLLLLLWSTAAVFIIVYGVQSAAAAAVVSPGSSTTKM